MALGGCPPDPHSAHETRVVRAGDAHPQPGDLDGDGAISVLLGGTDCNDRDPAAHPLAAELCNAADDDCDGLIDDADPDLVTGPLDPFAFLDADGDGYGDPHSKWTACHDAFPAGWVADNTDCDDADPVVPSGGETCAVGDQDCDGDPFDGSSPTLLSWRDHDGDGIGDGVPLEWCNVAPAGRVLVGGDCADHDAAIGLGEEWRADADGDGAGAGALVVSEEACVAPGPGWVPAEPADCDDADAQRSPGRYDDPDGQESDCDGFTDEGGPATVVGWIQGAWHNGVSPENWPAGLATLPDLDGDGRDEIAVGHLDLLAPSTAVRLTVDGDMPWLTAAPSSGIGAGSFVQDADLDQDGALDLLLGLSLTDEAAINGGQLAWHLSTSADPATASLLPHLSGSVDQEQFGVGFAVGHDEEGSPVVAATSAGFAPSLWLLPSPPPEGTDVHALAPPLLDPDADGVGAICSLGDVDGDGLDDIAVSTSPSAAAVRVLLGGSAPASVQDAPIHIQGAAGTEFGARLAATISDDGTASLVIAAPAAYDHDGALLVFDALEAGGIDESSATTVVAGVLQGRCGDGLGGMADLDLDGRRDLLLPCDGRLVVFLDVPGPQADAFDGIALSAPPGRLVLPTRPGDIDGDGVMDIVVAQPDAHDVAWLRFPL